MLWTLQAHFIRMYVNQVPVLCCGQCSVGAQNECEKKLIYVHSLGAVKQPQRANVGSSLTAALAMNGPSRVSVRAKRKQFPLRSDTQSDLHADQTLHSEQRCETGGGVHRFQLTMIIDLPDVMAFHGKLFEWFCILCRRFKLFKSHLKSLFYACGQCALFSKPSHKTAQIMLQSKSLSKKIHSNYSNHMWGSWTVAICIHT